MPVEPLPTMPLGIDVFLDANIMIYGVNSQSMECRALLERCAREDVVGITSVEVINEVTHRLMLGEALAKGFIARAQVNLLRRRVGTISQLTEYWRQVSGILQMNLLVLDLDVSRLHRAAALRGAHGLMTNDSMVLAALDEYGVECLATADGDFDHVPAITVYKPTDLP